MWKRAISTGRLPHFYFKQGKQYRANIEYFILVSNEIPSLYKILYIALA